MLKNKGYSDSNDNNNDLQSNSTGYAVNSLSDAVNYINDINKALAPDFMKKSRKENELR